MLAAAACGWGIALSGCATVSYYRQAAAGQLEILRLQEPIESVLQRHPDDPISKQLKLMPQLRTFAESELGLPARKNYTGYADLQREHVLWSVFAAPEFSLEAKSWFYPIVGSLDYRGFFDTEDAERCARSLRNEGFDVYVAGVDAYSTLGWFADPVLNTFVHYNESDLAELLFHELTHRRLYRSGETAFNEALATAVVQEGVMRWFQSTEQTAAARRYLARLRREDQIYRQIRSTRAQLADLFRSPLPVATLRRKKRELYTGLQEQLRLLFEGWGGKAPETWLQILPNNARLNASATYHEHVPAFRSFLHRDCLGDLNKFFHVLDDVDVDSFLQGAGPVHMGSIPNSSN